MLATPEPLRRPGHGDASSPPLFSESVVVTLRELARESLSAPKAVDMLGKTLDSSVAFTRLPPRSWYQGHIPVEYFAPVSTKPKSDLRLLDKNDTRNREEPPATQ
jgi:hypothetical protein